MGAAAYRCTGRACYTSACTGTGVGASLNHYLYP